MLFTPDRPTTTIHRGSIRFVYILSAKPKDVSPPDNRGELLALEARPKDNSKASDEDVDSGYGNDSRLVVVYMSSPYAVELFTENLRRTLSDDK